MKKIIQLLYVIPVIAFGQITSFDKLKKVSSKSQYLRTSIENGFEKVSEESVNKGKGLMISYAHMLSRDKKNANQFFWWIENSVLGNSWMLTVADEELYSQLLKSVKTECEFSAVVSYYFNDMVCYSCTELEAVIGVYKDDGYGHVNLFTLEEYQKMLEN
jgi:hypothetical protein